MPDETVWRALDIAAADFVRLLPQGLETPLGERGAGLSEGQLQRLAIARAILSGHPILLLDEATSALDEGTEGQLLDNLRSMTDRTVLIVIHPVPGPGALRSSLGPPGRRSDRGGESLKKPRCLHFLHVFDESLRYTDL